MQRAIARGDEAIGLKRTCAIVDWSPYFTSNTDRLSFICTDIGTKLGQALATEAPGLRSLHLIGTSAGSFAADACCRSYVAARPELPRRATVRLSLADPYAASMEAGFNEGRGAQFFGRDADFAEHILNTDDVVPNTDVPLQFCYCLDVTRAVERRTFPDPDPTGNFVTDALLTALKNHNWPLEYFARHCETRVDESGRVCHPSHDDFPRGKVVRVA